MTKNNSATVYLEEAVLHSISEIERGIKAFVDDEDDLAYRGVATELRKLLMDKDAVRSFHKSIDRAEKAHSLFELQYGNRRDIFLKSFSPQQKIQADNYVDVTPDIYPDREDVLICAIKDGTRVSLKEWLNESVAFSKNGEALNVGTMIKYIAGKEGSHIINPVGDKREDVKIGFRSGPPTEEEIDSITFKITDPWRQFIIDAGMRLLSATNEKGKSLIVHSIEIPDTLSTRSDLTYTVRIQRKRKRRGSI